MIAYDLNKNNTITNQCFFSIAQVRYSKSGKLLKQNGFVRYPFRPHEIHKAVLRKNYAELRIQGEVLDFDLI